MYSGTGYMTPGMYPRDVNLAEKKRFFPPLSQPMQTEIKLFLLILTLMSLGLSVL